MKKLILLTTILLASTYAHADVTVRAALTKKGRSISSEPIRVTPESHMAVFILDKGDSCFNRYTLKAVMKRENPYVFEIYRVDGDVETLVIITPELSELPSEVGLVINDEALTVVLEPVK